MLNFQLSDTQKEIRPCQAVCPQGSAAKGLAVWGVDHHGHDSHE